MLTIGQHYTNKNIFSNHVFIAWLNDAISNSTNTTILEPFAGKNSLIEMLENLSLIQKYKSFDINPKSPNVILNDSILNFPKNFDICITNPPFLAKTVATRKKIDINFYPYFDLYEKCLELCLDNCKYVAVIIPESFIVTKYFKNRLYAVISLTDKKLFNTTEHPVCLALFTPQEHEDFKVYRNESYLNDYKKTKKNIEKLFSDIDYEQYIHFHEKTGALGLVNIDATDVNKKIRFCEGSDILESDVSKQSKLRTRINILSPTSRKLSNKTIRNFADECNLNLNIYRLKTQDILMTSFKGLNNDGTYRRRLDYNTAKKIIYLTYKNFFNLT